MAFKMDPPAGASACSVVYGIQFPLNKLNLCILGPCVVAEKCERGVTTRGFLGFLLFARITQQQGCGLEQEHNSIRSFTDLLLSQFLSVGLFRYVNKYTHFPQNGIQRDIFDFPAS